MQTVYTRVSVLMPDLNDVDIIIAEGFSVDLVEKLRHADDVLVAVVDGHAQHAPDAVAVTVLKLHRTTPAR